MNEAIAGLAAAIIIVGVLVPLFAWLLEEVPE